MQLPTTKFKKLHGILVARIYVAPGYRVISSSKKLLTAWA